MTTTSDRVRIDARFDLPLEDGGVLPMSVPINATPTTTPGLVTFTVILGPLSIDSDYWRLIHVATGLPLGLFHQNKDDALALAAALAPLTDWTAEAPPRSLGPAVQELALAHGGITWDEYRNGCGR